MTLPYRAAGDVPDCCINAGYASADASGACSSFASPSPLDPNRRSSSCWALMKASLNAFASIISQRAAASKQTVRPVKSEKSADEWQQKAALEGKTIDLLSLLAKRMARVHASGSPSLTSAVAFQTQLRSLPTFGDSFIAGTTGAHQPTSTRRPLCTSFVVPRGRIESRLVRLHETYRSGLHRLSGSCPAS